VALRLRAVFLERRTNGHDPKRFELRPFLGGFGHRFVPEKPRTLAHDRELDRNFRPLLLRHQLVHVRGAKLHRVPSLLVINGRRQIEPVMRDSHQWKEKREDAGGGTCRSSSRFSTL
jgi:hypothetical protein